MSVRKSISQREARQLRKRVAELEQAQASRISRWNSSYVGGTQIAYNLSLHETTFARLDTAARLGFALVVKCGEGSNVHIYAVKP